MVEASRRPQEASGEEDELSASAWGRFGVEALLDDGLDSADEDEIEVQSALAGGVNATAAILVAQPQELLGLA